MTLLQDVTFPKKIFTAEIETADWDRNWCSPCVAQWKNQQILQNRTLICSSFHYPCPRKGNLVVLLDANAMNKIEGLLFENLI